MIFTPAAQVIPVKSCEVGPDESIEDLRPALPDPAVTISFQFLRPIPRPHRYWNTAGGRTLQMLPPRRSYERERTVTRGVTVARTSLPAGHGSGRRRRSQIQHDLLGRPKLRWGSTKASNPAVDPGVHSRSSWMALRAHRPRRRSTPTGSAYTMPATPSPDLRACRRRSCQTDRPYSRRAASIVGAQLIIDRPESSYRPDRVRRCRCPATTCRSSDREFDQPGIPVIPEARESGQSGKDETRPLLDLA